MQTKLTNEEHHRMSAISASGLKLIDRSPLHYWAAYVDPNREPRDPTAAMKLGTATHCAILEPAEFDARYTVLPEGLDRRTKEGKALYAEIEATGKTALSAPDWKRIGAMATAGRSHSFAAMLFDDGPEFETSLFWADPVSGVHCKARPDMMILPCADWPNGLIVDVKTTTDASPEGFGKSAWSYAMHLQAALYTEGFGILFNTAEPPPFMWLAVESDAPHAVAMYTASPAIIEYGRGECARLRDIYARCVACNDWPGYMRAPSELILPGYAMRVIETNETEVESISYV